MRSMAAFLLGLGAGLALRQPRKPSQMTPPTALVSRTPFMADSAPATSPLQAFLTNYQQASAAAWDAVASIETRLEQGSNPALKRQADALGEQIRAMSAIARTHAVQVLTASGAIATLNGLTQVLTDRAAELPAATEVIQGANAVVNAARSFVSFFR